MNKVACPYKVRRSVVCTFILVIAFFINVVSLQSQNDHDPVESTIIRNGMIYDGTGGPPYMADILIEDGVIKAISQKADELNASVVIDATGLVVGPGFIDVHAHGDPRATPEFKNFLSMGVTSIALGMDGSSPRVGDFEQWILDVSNVNPGVNVIPFIGHGTVRRESGIGTTKEPSKEELRKLQYLLNEAFQFGCWGVSMGLEYLPGYYAPEEELTAIATTVGENNGIVSSHIRNEDNDAIEASLLEMIKLAAHCPVNISHLKVVYGRGSGRAKELLALLDENRSSNYNITADFYPYSASYTGIGILFPEWAKTPKTYEAVKLEREAELLEFLRNKIIKRNGPEATLFGTGPYKGKTLQDLVDEYNLPYELILRDIIGPYGASAAYFVMDDELQSTLMLADMVAIGSDGSPTMHHPRGYGSFAKVIEETVQSDRLLSLEEAIYKMTGLSAQIIGLADRGLIKEGMQGDLIVFDPEKVRNNASFADPHQLASGFNYVFVNGRLVKKDKQFYNGNGKVLLKRN